MKANILITILVFHTVIGCVSVKLTNHSLTRSDSIKNHPPARPYVEINSDTDAAWKNPTNGSTISYNSSCQDIIDPSLHSIRDDLLGDVFDLQISKSYLKDFNARESLYTEAGGKVDGIPVKMILIVLKKGGCIFSVNYISLKDSFQSDLEIFQNFTKTFKVD